MKKIRNIFLAFMLGIVSQSNAFDVCAGDFFEKCEKKFEQIEENPSEYCVGFLNKNRQNEIQNAMKTDSKTDKLSALVDLGTAMEYLSAIITYEKMLRICSPNIQKLKARKAYFDMIVSDIIARQITYCNWYCKFFLTKSSCM